MARDRYQRGRVEETGKRVKKWKGHYYVYLKAPDGSEIRAHRGVTLGLKSEMKKWEAQSKLQEIIDKSTDGSTLNPSPACTFRWFWEQRYRPLKEPTWKASSAPKMVYAISRYIVQPFADVPLAELTRFELQKHLNSMAEKYSRSVVLNFRTYAKAILDEAVEQQFIARNPAGRLELPKTRKPSRRALGMEEIAQLLETMSGRDRLIVRMFLILGLRPGELFALRRDDRVGPNQIRIDESLAPKTGIVEPKSEASDAFVWLPASLAMELDFWMEAMVDKRPSAFLFASRSSSNTPLAANNFLKRVLHQAGRLTRARLEEQGTAVPSGFLEKLTHQALRRSCATHMQGKGSIKDIQAHLRHAQPNVTAEVYMQAIPESVRKAVESLDKLLCVLPPDPNLKSF
jgi:integrase